MLLLITLNVKIRLLKTFLYYQNYDGTSIEMGDKKRNSIINNKITLLIIENKAMSNAFGGIPPIQCDKCNGVNLIPSDENGWMPYGDLYEGY